MKLKLCCIGFIQLGEGTKGEFEKLKEMQEC